MERTKNGKREKNGKKEYNMIIGIEEEKGRVDSKSIPKRHKSEEEEEMPFFFFVIFLFSIRTHFRYCVWIPSILRRRLNRDLCPHPSLSTMAIQVLGLLLFFSSSCYRFAMQHRSRIEELWRWFRHTVATCLPITIKPFGGRDIFLVKSRSLWLNCCSCFVFFFTDWFEFRTLFLILQYATESRARFCFDVAESPPNG